MRLAKTLLIGAALVVTGGVYAANAQAPSVPPDNQNKSPSMSPPGTELPAPNTGMKNPNAPSTPNVGTRPMGPPAATDNDLKSPTTPNLKKLDEQGRGGQQQ